MSKKKMWVAFVAGSVLIASILAGVWLMRTEPEVPEKATEETEHTEDGASTEKHFEKETLSYDINVTETQITIPGLTKEYHFLYLTDTHIVVLDESDSDEIVEYANSRFGQFQNEEGVSSAEQFEDWIAYANEQQPDALLLGGDIIDSPSAANIEHLEQNFQKLTVPYLYTPGNHDWTFPWEYMTPYAQEMYQPLLAPYMKANPAIHEMELDEIIIVAVDNSTNQISPQVLEEYKKILQKEKPVIVMLHVPLLTQSVLTKAKEVWTSPVVLGGGNYGGIYPDETSTEFINLTTAEESPVVAVLAGHVHFYDQDMINENIVQIVGDAGFKSEAVRITIKGSAE